MNRTVKFALAIPLLFLLLCVCICSGHCIYEDVANRRMTDLLKGSTKREIQSFTVSGQREPNVEIRDPESLQYLTEAFRNAKYEGYVSGDHQHGCSYTASISLGSWPPSVISIRGANTENGLIVASSVDASFDDPIYYWVIFPEPIPPPVQKMFSHLRDKPAKPLPNPKVVNQPDPIQTP